MNTPICDFVKQYAEKNGVRAHMPGHKGKKLLGFEELDITEISGADSLYEADGIIKESEDNASCLFGFPTYYSTEGSSLCIRAMVFLLLQYAKEYKKEKLILAGRNAHKTFLSALCLTDMDVEWIYSEKSHLSCEITPDILEEKLSAMPKKPVAVYVTSPDYLGRVCRTDALSEVCKRHGVLLCVDNAHGAYLKFLENSLHPCDLGADMCCDSAHKTLPALTGGAYLHISGEHSKFFCERAKDALSLFGSTSPSYLILQSLDAVNKYISDGYREKLNATAQYLLSKMVYVKDHGLDNYSCEPLKICLQPKSFGYTGNYLAKILSEKGIECEFSDPDNTVLMLSPENTKEECDIIINALLETEKLSEIKDVPPKPSHLKRAMSVREAMFSESEMIKTCDALGRVLAAPNVSCPPAVPVAVCGEVLDENAVEAFCYYGIEYCRVCCEK